MKVKVGGAEHGREGGQSRALRRGWAEQDMDKEYEWGGASGDRNRFEQKMLDGWSISIALVEVVISSRTRRVSHSQDPTTGP